MTDAAARITRQCGVATRAQLMLAGWSEDRIRGQLEARRWRALSDRVVVTHNGPLTKRQMLWAVVLSAPALAALCGPTGLGLFGMSDFDDTSVHVVVRRGARPLPVAGVDTVVHESRRFGPLDRWEIAGLPVTPIARAVIDTAAWCDDPKAAARTVVAAVQRRKTRPVLLREELERAGSVRHCKLLRSMLSDLEGGAEALSEVEFLAFCRRNGFPRPQLQHRLDTNGRRRYLDAVFRLAGGGVVRVEIDGGIHLSLTARWQDTSKDNDAALDGKLVLRFPSVAIYTDDPVAVAQLRRALGLVSGWRAYSPASL